MPIAAIRPDSRVPCLAGLYLALGADDAPAAPGLSGRRRGVAALAACVLGLGTALWPVAPAVALTERPTATLPEWADLATAELADAAG